MIYTGHTGHCRFEPVRHAFTYPLFFISLDVSEIPKLGLKLFGFGYNRFSLASIWDRDYLRGEGSIEARARALLESRGIQAVGRIQLLTMPRVLGYVFNPVSFYCCYDTQNELQAVIAEVNNTFDESHIYILQREEGAAPQTLAREFSKDFFVSPFFNREGTYELRCKELEKRMEIEVHVNLGGRRVFSSSLVGEGEPLTTRTLLRTLLRFPFTAWMTMMRIYAQAALLKFKRGLPVKRKPEMGPGSFVRRRVRRLSARMREWVVNSFHAAQERSENDFQKERL